MKVVVTATGDGLDSAVDGRFGRCAKFLFYDTETDDVLEVLDNPAASAPGGAGIQAAQLVVEKGAKAVLTGNIGPNASGVLSQAGIAVYTGLSGTVKDAIESFKSGNLQQTSGPTVASHTGMSGGEVDPPPASGPPSGPGRGGGMGRGIGRGGGPGRGGGMGRGMGRGGGRGWGPPAECLCPSCGKRVPHTPGVPCRTMQCPDCGTLMVRGD